MFVCMCIFFFKQKTAYEMRISDWSSDVCSSDLVARNGTPLDGSPPSRNWTPSRLAALSLISTMIASTSTCSRATSSWRITSPSIRCVRSEEHTSELKSLMRISYAVFCLKKKNKKKKKQTNQDQKKQKTNIRTNRDT